MNKRINRGIQAAGLTKKMGLIWLWICVWFLISGSWLLVAEYQTRAVAASFDGGGWREAEPGYRFSFPQDHAAHPGYRIEWWYYTGNVEAQNGRRFGYQLTFFRTGVVPEPTNPSRWAVRDLYMAHFAFSDIEREEFYTFERLNRAGIGWAGAAAEKYRVWNQDWSVQLEGGDHLLTARADNYAIELRLTPEKPIVIHGEKGISQKGASMGNASHYYSLTRLRTVGRLVVDGEVFAVSGLSWMDHEFGTSFLEAEQIGWDWFSLQLENGSDVMLFQLRRADGTVDPHSSGTLIDAAGQATHLRSEEFSLIPRQQWRSPASGATYPTTWTIVLPQRGVRLTVRAAFPGQELRTGESTGVTYWEGSVSVTGEAGNQNVRGRGYLEMTGYTGRSMGEVFAID